MDIQELFFLENYAQLFEKAVTPPSIGGDNEFKLLALIGDKCLIYYSLRCS